VAKALEQAKQGAVDAVLKEPADQPGLELVGLLQRLLSDSSITQREREVTCRSTWSEDTRLLAASLLSNLPTWKAADSMESAERPLVVAFPEAKAEPALPAPVVATAPAATVAEPEVEATPFEKHVARQFEERIPAIVLRGMKLHEFSRFLSRMTGITLVLDEEALQDAGIDPTTPLNVDLTSATIGEILDATLSGHQLGYIAAENRVLITTRTKAEAGRQH
jgi:hypothetical protein